MLSNVSDQSIFKQLYVNETVAIFNSGFATLIRNPKGIEVFDTTILCHDIYEDLCYLPNMSADEARQLLDPADKQNVPKAVKLIQNLLRLKMPDVRLPSLPPTLHRRRIICFLAEVFGLFTLPFIDVKMSLSVQIRSLAAYAHLLAVMWIQHGTRFITGALYADSQAIIKNIVISIARLQQVDENLPFYIIFEGTDRLEGVFSACRTQDHARNFDILQLAEKLSIGALVQSIFERNPDLDRGHRRLTLKDADGIDHVNPHSWQGNVRVGDVELEAEWVQGRDEANRLLVSYFGASARVNFEALLRHGGGDRDLLRPAGTYVGSEYQPDDARTEAVEVGSVFATQRDEGASTMNPSTTSLAPQPPPPTPTHQTTLTASAALHQDRAGTTTDTIQPQSHGDSDGDDGEYDDLPEGVDVDDFFSSRTDASGPPSSAATLFADDKWLVINGKKYLKASIVAIYLTAKRARKVTIRTLRNRGVTLEDLHGSTRDRFNSIDLTGEDLVKSGDIAAVLIRIGREICLAAVEVLEFHLTGDKARKVTAVELTTLEQRSGPSVKVVVQILKLRHVDESKDGSEESTGGAWLWTHQYATILMKSKTTTRTHRTLQVPGFMLYPLGPSIVLDPTGTPETPERHEPGVNPLENVTWELTHTQLQECLDVAWSALSPETPDILANIEHVPVVASVDGLPYCSHSGMYSLECRYR